MILNVLQTLGGFVLYMFPIIWSNFWDSAFETVRLYMLVLYLTLNIVFYMWKGQKEFDNYRPSDYLLFYFGGFIVLWIPVFIYGEMGIMGVMSLFLFQACILGFDKEYGDILRYWDTGITEYSTTLRYAFKILFWILFLGGVFCDTFLSNYL